MNRNKQIHLWILLILIAGAITVSAATASAQDIHVLMVIDDGNPWTFKQHARDKDRIENLMKSSVASMLEKERPGATVNIDELKSNVDSFIPDNPEFMSRDNILKWVRNVNADRDDVVFVYFSGAGGAEKEAPHERYLYAPRWDAELYRKLYRKELAKAVEELNCRLKILITEINIGRTVHQSVPLSYGNRNYLRQLFLEHEGFLNLTSTSLGGIALGDYINGGWFTLALTAGILGQSIVKLEDIDQSPQDGFVSWKEVFIETKEYLDEFYKLNEHHFRFPPRLRERLKERNQTTQIPEVLSEFPKRIH